MEEDLLRALKNNFQTSQLILPIRKKMVKSFEKMRTSTRGQFIFEEGKTPAEYMYMITAGELML